MYHFFMKNFNSETLLEFMNKMQTAMQNPIIWHIIIGSVLTLFLLIALLKGIFRGFWYALFLMIFDFVGLFAAIGITAAINGFKHVPDVKYFDKNDFWPFVACLVFILILTAFHILAIILANVLVFVTRLRLKKLKDKGKRVGLVRLGGALVAPIAIVPISVGFIASAGFFTNKNSIVKANASVLSAISRDKIVLPADYYPFFRALYNLKDEINMDAFINEASKNISESATKKQNENNKQHNYNEYVNQNGQIDFEKIFNKGSSEIIKEFKNGFVKEFQSLKFESVIDKQKVLSVYVEFAKHLSQAQIIKDNENKTITINFKDSNQEEQEALKSVYNSATNVANEFVNAAVQTKISDKLSYKLIDRNFIESDNNTKLHLANKLNELAIAIETMKSENSNVKIVLNKPSQAKKSFNFKETFDKNIIEKYKQLISKKMFGDDAKTQIKKAQIVTLKLVLDAWFNLQTTNQTDTQN
ncbi:Hypothetical protein MBVG_2990 [Mycoplasmopsis bovigenitalium 51080]|uniref:Uncharacterized protein n=2 Tax=Mycoplasmopsis bovigenitalium TaxID=2112 RepID=N9TUD1_9BACT|nr:Hypothetical protein MBVG_2990 [Mycoplasmopsis bovigenitalium 51080]